ncbi:hypothetical protein BKH41_06830 [Helicobacter sp. 12S02232-10]|uniref:MATE family efflux transporter n=1 Tax=Helicobacter sp. 12S02232-10 TaxID=1476197 RepID=UPI000BA5F29E|nr:MATE family efflux transporter [Helicobacter sp. 12S02232-10]PAF47967.1 hypothetical protein BKH41_06830 [Helicobacter sp. 12S02232-10]
MFNIDLRNDSIKKLFFYYFIPSLCAMIALSTYSTVDGIFVGKKLGEDALAAISICWPVFPVLIAYELLFSLGAASIISYFLGRNEVHRARLIFSSVFYFVVISTLIVGGILYIFIDEIALILGSSDVLKPLVIEYLEIIFIGSVFMVLHPLSDVFAINDKQPILAMVAMIVGSLANIILNYLFLFIFETGIYGSALATIMGHGIGFLVLLQHFLFKRGKLYFVRRFSLSAVISSAKSGIPQSVSELSAAIVMLMFNTTIMGIAGERGVSIYGIIMYSGIIFFTVLLAIAQGIQPIASFSYGAGSLKRVKNIFLFGIGVSIGVGIFIYLIFYAFDEHLVRLFLKDDVANRDPYLLSDTVKAMNVYYLGYILLGINVVCAIFFQSVQRTGSSFIITISYTLVFLVVLLPVLSRRYQMEGVWVTYPISQFLAFLVVGIVILYEKKSGIFSQNFMREGLLWRKKK